MIPGGSWSNLLTRAVVFLKSVKANETEAVVERPSADEFAARAIGAIETLNEEWYDPQRGIWDEAWWNSGNALTTLADFASIRAEDANSINVGGYMHHTFLQAQNAHVTTMKELDNFGMVVSLNCMDDDEGCPPSRASRRSGRARRKRNFQDFVNDFYDDEGWWALALIRSFDVTEDRAYLDDAVIIFNDMMTGLGGPCNGGLFWSKERKYVNAITNELYLSVAASLANRIPSDPRYLQIARDQWAWFKASGMINKNNLINDGLDGSCKNNGMQTWSYNQGVVLGGLVELHRANGGNLNAAASNMTATNGNSNNLLAEAKTIARAAIKHLSNPDGILVETDKCELRGGHCGRDGQQFKGIFVRNLRYLHEASPEPEFRDFILDQAEAVWENNRDKSGRLGVAWAGPFVKATGPSHSCALDAIVAAAAVA